MTGFVLAIEDPEPRGVECFYPYRTGREIVAMRACEQANGGAHRWELICPPGETASLKCADCPADGDDLMPDHTYCLSGEVEHLGRVIHLDCGQHDMAEETLVRVTAEVENIIHPGGPWGSTEYDVVIHTKAVAS